MRARLRAVLFSAVSSRHALPKNRAHTYDSKQILKFDQDSEMTQIEFPIGQHRLCQRDVGWPAQLPEKLRKK